MHPDLWELYRQMLRSRLFEEAVALLWQRGPDLGRDAPGHRRGGGRTPAWSSHLARRRRHGPGPPGHPAPAHARRGPRRSSARVPGQGRWAVRAAPAATCTSSPPTSWPPRRGSWARRARRPPALRWRPPHLRPGKRGGGLLRRGRHEPGHAAGVHEPGRGLAPAGGLCVQGQRLGHHLAVGRADRRHAAGPGARLRAAGGERGRAATWRRCGRRPARPAGAPAAAGGPASSTPPAFTATGTFWATSCCGWRASPWRRWHAWPGPCCGRSSGRAACR